MKGTREEMFFSVHSERRREKKGGEPLQSGGGGKGRASLSRGPIYPLPSPPLCRHALPTPISWFPRPTRMKDKDGTITYRPNFKENVPVSED